MYRLILHKQEARSSQADSPHSPHASIIVADYLLYSESLVPLPDGRVHCKLCDKFLAHKGAGVEHLDNVHCPRPLQCVVCEEVLGNDNKFRKHMLRVHGVKGVKNIRATYGRDVSSSQYKTEEEPGQVGQDLFS